MSYITTYSKKHFNPVNPDINDIDINDIVHALSLLCRANGHFPHFYSVAQHSLNCMIEAERRGYSRRVQLGCLLHDASEAYLSDITRPVKALLPEYLHIEEKLQRSIFDKWLNPSLTQEELKDISDVDDAILYHEFFNLMGEKINASEPKLESNLDIQHKDFGIVKTQFIQKFNELTGNKTEKFVGVDWMKGKWLAVELCGGNATMNVFENISELCGFYKDLDNILIDVPIGLPETAEEAPNRPDTVAREFLKVKDRKASIFNTPFRPLVYSKNQAEFWNLAKTLGNKITPQSYGIIKCIRQVDSFLNENPEWKNRLVESHPECAFQALNKGKGLEFSKHTEEGIALRTEILAPYAKNLHSLVGPLSTEIKKDALDACCLAVTVMVGFKSIPDNPQTDKQGLKMQIVIADIKER